MPREKADTTLQRRSALPGLRHGQRRAQRRALVYLKEESSGTSADNFQSVRYAVLLKRSAEKKRYYDTVPTALEFSRAAESCALLIAVTGHLLARSSRRTEPCRAGQAGLGSSPRPAAASRLPAVLTAGSSARAGGGAARCGRSGRC